LQSTRLVKLDVLPVKLESTPTERDQESVHNAELEKNLEMDFAQRVPSAHSPMGLVNQRVVNARLVLLRIAPV